MGRWRTYASPTYRAGVAIVEPMVLAAMRHDWRGASNLPREGGFLVACNHISNVDPLILGHFLVDQHVVPHFLAKHTLFATPGFGWLLRQCEQVPVVRGTAQAADSLVAAERALEKGYCVVILPEGTLTRDPDLWPMRGKTGIARVALRTGAPVIPVAQWGAQDILPPEQWKHRARRRLRPTVTVQAGPAVDLADLRQAHDQGAGQAMYHEATDRIMAAVTAQLETIRGPRPAPRPTGADDGPPSPGSVQGDIR